MALTIGLAYNDDYGRVQITITGASTDADYARVEHSFDQITWATIRGGDTVPLSGGAGHVDHYDGYSFGVPNYYRVTAVDNGLIPSFVAAGTAQTGNNTSLVPPHPSGLAVGHLKLIFASIRNSGAGTVNAPTGWTKVAENGNEAILGRIHQGGDTAPTVTFAGGVANADTLAQMACFANAQLVPAAIQVQTNPVAQDIAGPAIVQQTGMIIAAGWKQDDFTSSTTPAFATKIGDMSSTAGDDASACWFFLGSPRSNEGLSYNPWPVTITGGATAISRALTALFPVVTFTDQGSQSLTPVLPNPNVKPYWLMNPQRPGQNIRVEITDMTEITNDARNGVIEVLGRTDPVVVSDFMSSDTVTISIDAATKLEARDIAGRLRLGDPMYLLVPDDGFDVDTFYFTTMSLSRKLDAKRSSWTVDVTCRAVAQPAPSVYGSTYVWGDVVADYATWTAVVSDPQNTSWSNLVDRISDDVIVVP